ncbi:MAG: family 16 glycoside hydrolase [Planctomycetota bacterium]|jgi:hypothetical protein
MRIPKSVGAAVAAGLVAAAVTAGPAFAVGARSGGDGRVALCDGKTLTGWQKPYTRGEASAGKGEIVFKAGKKVVKIDAASDERERADGRSKFRKFRDFARSKSGRIMLQDHGGPVWFRDVRIRELAPE